MSNRRQLYVEPFNGLEELVTKLREAALFANANKYTAPSIEARSTTIPGETARLVILEETLSDQSTQLVAVVYA